MEINQTGKGVLKIPVKQTRGKIINLINSGSEIFWVNSLAIKPGYSGQFTNKHSKWVQSGKVKPFKQEENNGN